MELRVVDRPAFDADDADVFAIARWPQVPIAESRPLAIHLVCSEGCEGRGIREDKGRVVTIHDLCGGRPHPLVAGRGECGPRQQQRERSRYRGHGLDWYVS